MQRAVILWLALLFGVASLRVFDFAHAALVTTANVTHDRLPPYQPRFGRARPVVVVLAENYYTELTDYMVPYGIISASGAADVIALATKPGPIRMFPAPMEIEPQETTAQFDQRVPEGADYVIVPAVHRDSDLTLVSWVADQAKKGATIVGVCDGVWVVARAGLLDGRRATGHWYSMDDLRKQFPKTRWIEGKRYIADGKVVTTTGVTATIPASFAIVEAIAGSDRANQLAESLGRRSWSSEIQSSAFRLDLPSLLTIARNYVSFWSYEDVGIPIASGVDEISLALQADVYSTTFRSTAYTVAQSRDAVRTRRGIVIVPDRVARIDAPGRMLPAPDSVQPLRALDESLKAVANGFGDRTAAWVALQMQYPGY
ncbi:ThiJ/PfpI family protein [Paraburkholderia piptadeniae]|uniref:ThiJ/PfpI family protein n=1 Tax=Paraburkholderia piptadeniae TaxID=1701573 RepID=A0A1N7RQ17_9BURK|nr:DJ-1/PfpI family protein [Paraburkholderia piptadeniae]SIT37149.1 ThiJ/PfpI family protein [Paraburkholderia piptadeniae]